MKSVGENLYLKKKKGYGLWLVLVLVGQIIHVFRFPFSRINDYHFRQMNRTVGENLYLKKNVMACS
jgi:hypothetical protein